MELLDTMQLRLLKEKLIEMNEVDIAAFIEELDSEKTVVAVSYTHLDVYKRQSVPCARFTARYGVKILAGTWTSI